MNKTKILILLLFIGSSICSFAAFPQIPQTFYDSIESKFLSGERRLVIWQCNYTGYAVTFNDSIFTEYFLYADTLNREIHSAVIRQFSNQDHHFRYIYNTKWARLMSPSLSRDFADSLKTFFHYDIISYHRIDTIYTHTVGINFPPKTIWLYNEDNSLAMQLSDDEWGFVNDECLRFILQNIYYHYEYFAYWELDRNPKVKWWLQRPRSIYRTSYQLKRWFARRSTFVSTIPY